MRLALAVAAALTVGAGSGPAGARVEPVVDYAQEANWLCLPGRDDACGKPLPTAALDASGYGSVSRSVPAKDPPIDCFYVYPTVSRDPTLNSDLNPGPEEEIAAIRFARFASVCRPFAPLYRQMSLAALPRWVAGEDVSATGELAYRDVLAAWRHYLAHHNRGRPFALVGHSQGTVHLTRLLREEIEGSLAAARMLSAMLVGFNIEVPQGKVVGGTFRSTPLCTRAGQTGCVITYVSFRGTNPPPEGALFGRAARPGMTVACTNPARLAGNGSARLDSYWYAGPPAPGAQEPVKWATTGAPPTPFLRTEGLVSAACVNRGQLGYLSVVVNSDPADARTDRIPGDVSIAGQVQPGWGLHLAEMNLALGDLIHLLEAQASSARPPR